LQLLFFSSSLKHMCRRPARLTIELDEKSSDDVGFQARMCLPVQNTPRAYKVAEHGTEACLA
jgi:hypothetical protein